MSKGRSESCGSEKCFVPLLSKQNDLLLDDDLVEQDAAGHRCGTRPSIFGIAVVGPLNPVWIPEFSESMVMKTSAPIVL